MSPTTVPSLDGFHSGYVNPQWVCGNNLMVLKVAPPLVVTEAQLGEFVEAVREVVDLMHTSSAFWSEALGLLRRVVIL
jgi:ornithine--oxo-acid transaminase